MLQAENLLWRSSQCRAFIMACTAHSGLRRGVKTRSGGAGLAPAVVEDHHGRHLRALPGYCHVQPWEQHGGRGCLCRLLSCLCLGGTPVLPCA